MAGSLTPPHEPSSPVDGGIRKRVCKACDRCRLKKSKCDGSSPCSRCKADNAICFFGERKKSHDKVYPKGYVEMLENQQSQLVSGLQELYRRLQNGQGWTGSPLKETPTGSPLTHDILERLGALKQDGHTTNEAFEENLETLQQKLLASGAGYMQRETSFDNNSEIDQTPVYEHSLPQRSGSLFNGTFSFPPTPPIQSPHPRMVHTSSPLKSQFAVDMTHVSQYQAWPSDIDEMVYMPTTAEPIQDMELDAMAAYAESLYPVEGAINPCLTIKDWQQQQDLSKYYGHNLAV